PRHPCDEENQQLRRENQYLTGELRKAEIVIEVQKKVAALLGRPILAPDREGKPRWSPSPHSLSGGPGRRSTGGSAPSWAPPRRPYRPALSVRRSGNPC